MKRLAALLPLMRLQLCRLLVGLVTALLIVACIDGGGMTTVSAATYTYDGAPSTARVDVHATWAFEASPVRLGDVPEVSVSPGASLPGASSTLADPVVATEAAGAPRVTEPMIRDAMADAPLQTQQGAVSLPKVQSAVDQLAAGSPAPPIRVDGSIIVDGNHRYIAGQIMGQPPAVQPWPGGNPARVIPWWKQVIDPTDWGG